VRLEDARRLTGPNLHGRRPLVVVEVVLEPDDTLSSVRAVIHAELTRLRDALSLAPVELKVVRATPTWAAMAFEAPLDEMLVDAEALEWATQSAVEVLAGRPALPLEPKTHELAELWSRERAPQLEALAQEAARRDVPFLWDDEQVTLGHGRRAVHFDRHALTDQPAVPWDSLGRVPIALITGTNGKTTSTRLLARMVEASGRVVGSSCSDSVTIAGKTVREGDWTGPAAARLVLRSPEVEVAVLETARGGILRRGLATDLADVALITNVSDDHLGSSGIDDLDGMLEVKAVIARAVRPEGTVVLNARDPRLVALGRELACHVTFFHDGPGDSAVSAHDGQLFIGATPLLPLADIPITFDGTARYNVENALGATAAALALGVPPDAIARALRSFDAAANPGRGETWTHAGVTLFADFAHNPEGVSNALHVATSLRSPTGRLFVITGSAGDRSDAELEAIIDRIHATAPAKVYVRELQDYLRGREPGVVPAIFLRAFEARGVPITLARSEVDALEQVTKETRPGDVIALLVHVDRDEVRAFSRAWAEAS